MSNSPIDELKNLHGWSPRQITGAIDAERQREDICPRDAALRILERARASKPTYAQLEAEIALLKDAFTMAEDTLIAYGINSQAVRSTIEVIRYRKGEAMTAEGLRNVADRLFGEAQHLNAQARRMEASDD